MTSTVQEVYGILDTSASVFFSQADADERFFQTLQHMKHNDGLTREVFQEMLTTFLDQKETTKKEDRMRRRQTKEQVRPYHMYTEVLSGNLTDSDQFSTN